MGFSEAVKVCLKKYAGFSGRARRAEYWWFYLAFLLGLLGLSVLAAILGALSEAVGGIVILLMVLAALALVIPSLAVTVRRLHDTDRSGWWYLISFVPLVGPFILLYFLVLRGTSGDNRFGGDPLAPETVPQVFD